MEVPEIQIEGKPQDLSEDELNTVEDVREQAEDSKSELSNEEILSEAQPSHNEIPLSTDESRQSENENKDEVLQSMDESKDEPPLSMDESKDEEPPSIEEIPESQGEGPKSTEEIPQSKDESQDEDLQNVEEIPQSTAESPDEVPQSGEEIPQSTAETLDEIPQSGEEIPQSTAETLDEVPQSGEEMLQSLAESLDEVLQSGEELPQSKDESLDEVLDEEDLLQDMNQDDAPQSTEEPPQRKTETSLKLFEEEDDDDEDFRFSSRSRRPSRKSSVRRTKTSQDEDSIRLSSPSRFARKSSVRSRTRASQEEEGSIPGRNQLFASPLSRKSLLRIRTKPTQEEEENPPSSSEKSSAKSKTKSSPYLVSHPSGKSYHNLFNFSSTRSDDELEPPTETESEEFLSTSELPLDLGEFSSSAWQDSDWTHDIYSTGTPVCKRSYHDCCCSSVMEQLIQHSPESCAKKVPCHRNLKKLQSSKRKKPVGILKKPFREPLITSPFAFSKGSRRSGRRIKALYNLYTTFCDEKEEFGANLIEDKEPLYASGLTRACTIFHFIRNGKINADNLLLTLHMLGIMMTVPELKQVLEYVPIDAQRNMEFSEFLDAVNVALPFADTKGYCTALQIAQEVFKKLKKEMVFIEELELTLAALGVTMSPTIIERALKRVRITWDGKLNITDFLLTVHGPLISYSKVAAINECAALDMRSESPDREMRTHVGVTFYDADQAFSLNQIRRDTTESQRSAEMKRPKTAPILGPGGEEKYKTTFEWPKVRPTFGYTSQDTLFPISINLLLKDEFKKPQGRLSWTPEQDSVPLSPAQLKLKYAVLEQKKKKKRLSFPKELPKRYYTENTEKEKSDVESAKGEIQEGVGGLTTDLFAKGGS